MKKNFIIDDVNRSLKQNNAGYKARDDVNFILEKEGYQQDYLLSGNSKLSRLLHFAFLLLKLKRKAAFVVIQYPYYINMKYQKWMNSRLPKNTVLLIHDIDSLRDQMDEEAIKKEIAIFNTFESIISHNEKMSAWLIRNGCTSKIVNLEIFDYIITYDIEKKLITDNEIAFAGNLSSKKSGFLYNEKLKKLTLNVYGSNFVEGNYQNISYKGTYPAEKLPSVLNERFGLIWDGESIDSCLGSFGNYLKYNNPHKTSLYLVSKLPVIVWEESAMAPFVKKHNVGICINSLNDLENVLNSLKEDEYKLMKDNVNVLSERIKDGYFLKQAIERCKEVLS